MRRCLTCSGRYEPRRLICPQDRDMLIDEGAPGAETGQVLGGRFRLGNVLGEGGMGRVFEAVRLDTGDVVAVKLLKCGMGSSVQDLETSRMRFQLEAQAAAALEHPGIIRVIELDSAPDGDCYLVLERLYGATFDELRRAGKLSTPERVVELMREVCEVLAFAHEKGIVHRDLKPSNLYLHRIDKDRSCVKVLDFGIAKFLDHVGERLTASGEFVGTLLYMPPEQASGHAVCKAMDVYALGVILFEALTGKVPFTGRNPLELLRQHLSAPVPSLSAIRPDISLELDAIVGRCLSKKPEMRYADARGLAEALASIRSVHSEAQPASATRTLRANPSQWVGLLLEDRYEIQEWVARSRFGSDVYRAIHLKTGANIAVRLWRTGSGPVRDCLIDAFRREARSMEVRHPNLITVLDLGYNDDCVYIVTDLVDSISLRNLLLRKGPLAHDVTSRLVRGAAEALGALHARGLVSGGLTPDTMRVTSGPSGPERLMLSPFGLTSLRQLDVLFRHAGAMDEDDRSLDYISPEQKAGAEPDARSDLYSLAIIALEMLGGRFERPIPSAGGERVPGPLRATLTQKTGVPAAVSPDGARPDGGSGAIPGFVLPRGLTEAQLEPFLRTADADPARRPADVARFLERLPAP